jgi:hypothetical protein
MSELELEEPPIYHQEAKSDDLSASQFGARGIAGVRIGVVVAVLDDGHTPLVVFPGQRGTAAVRARTTIDIHGSHIGREVVLMFENGDAQRPLVLGCVVKDNDLVEKQAAMVEVHADGQRLVVSAKGQLVLRCGRATITLTRAGKVLIEGTYISSRSSGVNRVKGGSVQLN